MRHLLITKGKNKIKSNLHAKQDRKFFHTFFLRQVLFWGINATVTQFLCTVLHDHNTAL